MNATVSIQNLLPSPLPAILEHPYDGFGRRQRINGFDLSFGDLDRFNGLLARLGRRQEPLGRDQLATAGRELCDRSIHDFSPPCIRQRLRRIAMVEQMVGDLQWTPADDVLDTANLVVDYARGQNDLIPDWLPKVGRLDEAIVVDTAWPQLTSEVEDYMDYCRLRTVQAHAVGRNVSDYRFSREDWEQARFEELAYVEHERQIRESSYLTTPAPIFRVH